MPDVRMNYDSMKKMEDAFSAAHKQLDDSMRTMQKLAKMMEDGALVGDGGTAYRGAIEQKLLKRIEWPRTSSFKYLLVDDDQSSSRMHARYLFSIKGGIALDNGFQRLSSGRKVTVSPIGKAVHEELLRTYLDQDNDMVIRYQGCIGPA